MSANPLLLNNGVEAKTFWSNLDSLYKDLEKDFFNPAGYIPVLGSLTGVCRIAYGSLQCTISPIGTFIENMCGLFTSDRANSIRRYDGAGASAEHTIHGALNIIRGTVELVPLLPLITCAPLDASGLKYRYRSEMGDHKIVPITMDHIALVNNPMTVDKKAS